MKYMIALVLFFTSIFHVCGQNAWKKEGIKLPYPICYGSNESHPSYLGPPSEYYERLKSATIKKPSIEVSYIGFSNEAQQAFQYAVDIWKNMIYTPVPIRIQANWQSLSTGVLGNCGPANYYKNFNSTQKWDCYYPVVLVEKMLGEEVNGVDQFDITAAFNKDFGNWYFGTDGNTPPQKYDFVSTVLHELTHGLGFSGFFYSNRGRGGYGNDGLAAIFDQFVIGKDGNRLVNTSIFPNPSTKLNQAFTSGWIEFNTKLVESKLPRLYAPSTWDDGSSIYHLDDVSYPTGDPNSLMTPFTGTGEAIHFPGPDALAIMYDIGWKSISIKHKQLKDIEFISSSTPVEFNSVIESDYDLDLSKLFLVYSTNKFSKVDSVLLKATNIPANYIAKLSNLKDGEVDYFFTATDEKNRRFVFPSNAPSRYLHFKIGIDKESPMVIHQPVNYMISTNLSVKIDAEVTDNIGVKSVKMEYFINGGLIQEISLKNDTNDIYTGNLVFPTGSLKDGDKISYRIVAVDASSQSNIGKSPVSGYYTFLINGIQKPVDKYVNNFNTETNDFISSDFKINSVAGFDSPALNSAHPYLSPEMDNMNYNFIAILKYPIILKDGGKMSFDEIVLVEPGDAGTKFGDQNFYDYVIVEGSKDGGNIWKPLIDGYDSYSHTSWYNFYNSSISGNNSIAVPTKDLFVKREFDLLANGNFMAGDTVQIRFRLFSDPYSNGWGWIIDNLNIQDVGTNVNSLTISSGEILLFPNPATDGLNIQLQTQKTIEKLIVKSYNSLGKLIYNQQFAVGTNNFQKQIDLRNFSPGLYLFTVGAENGQGVARKILIR
jgi:hypothetical protein